MTSEGTLPRVIANCAVSLDGRLAYAHGRRARLSGPEDLARVMRLRADSDAILVGAGTVRLDDPSLRVHWELLPGPPGKDPLRVVLDAHEPLPRSVRVLDGSRPTVIATTERAEGCYPPTVEVFRTPGERVDLPALLQELGRRRVRQLMVEGGSEVLSSFLRAGLVDELTVYVAPLLIGGRTAPGLVGGPESPGPESTIRLEQLRAEPLGDGIVLAYRGPRAPL